MATKNTNVESIVMRPIEVVNTKIHIVGTTPLIMHAWSDKAIQMMLDAQMGKAKGKQKEIKNPVEDFIRSAYWLTPMPAEYTEEAFQEAIVNGARFGFPYPRSSRQQSAQHTGLAGFATKWACAEPSSSMRTPTQYMVQHWQTRMT